MKKKILIFVPEFPRLTETFIEREINKLIERNALDITVFSLEKASGYAHPAVEKATYYERLTLANCFEAVAHALVNPFRTCKAAWTVLVQSDTVPVLPNFSKGWQGYVNARLVHFLKGIAYTILFKKFKPDHIHAHWMSDSSTIALIASIMLNVPLSISGHAKDILVDGTLIAQKVKHAKFVDICNNHAYKKCLELAKGVDTKNVYMRLHGVDLTDVLAKVPKLEKRPSPLILNINRLVEKKGIKYLIEASKLLTQQNVAHEINIVGLGPIYEELLSYIAELGVSATVKIVGDNKGLPNVQALGLMQIADVYVHSGVQDASGDSDGIPNSLIEAALIGTPIVATLAGSNADLVENNVTGLLVPQRDAQAIAQAIKAILTEPTMASNLVDSAKARAKQLFDIDANVGALETLLL